jgi:hypothetical protein
LAPQIKLHINGFELWTHNLFWSPMVPNKGYTLASYTTEPSHLEEFCHFWTKACYDPVSLIKGEEISPLSISILSHKQTLSSKFTTRKSGFFLTKSCSSHVWGKLVVWFITTHNMWCLLWYMSH